MRTALTNPAHRAPTQPEHLPPPSPAAALTRGEDRNAYDTLRRRMVAQMRPGDVVEEVLVADYCDLVWEAARLRRVRARQLESLEHLGVADVLEPQSLTFGTCDLGERWARRDPKVVKQVEDGLAKAGLTFEHVAARSFALQMGDMERFDRLIAATETRRAAALREFERHRAALARDMRSAEDVEDVNMDQFGARPARIDPRDGLVADAFDLDEADDDPDAFA